MLKIIEDQQSFHAVKIVAQLFILITRTKKAEFQSVCKSNWDVIWILNGCKRNKKDTIGKMLSDLGAKLDRQTCFTNPSRSNQGDNPVIWRFYELSKKFQFSFAANKSWG